MRIDIDLRRLRLFVEVVRQGGFSRAAQAAFATQPTVSKAVKQLEDELGVPLLDRSGRRSELTTAGKIGREQRRIRSDVRLVPAPSSGCGGRAGRA
jgi:DNA-binding transcriptional LysR family regulator